ncbi:glycosyltransferase [Xenorhabdus sp. 12]|uniref:Glycosyltransferase n=1 Tax=Xenorhabdus santafensis TaxID=2582833 RepID=A0ABU4S5B8_9GAMM|nr:glycosyltransferase [Xenorhabdus sp. 12]MDX7986411.1 glycosyltransferase [Xenorhabdus sp. 12]
MISVVMAVNRYDKHVDLSIQSILQQTFQSFELIIVANGSNHIEITNKLNFLCKMDSRIKVHFSPIGQLAFALNYAISKSSYDIIARMDSDDISVPERLEKQFAYLEKNQLDLVGSAINLIDDNDNFLRKRLYPHKDKIKKQLPFKNCFAHPSLMFRKDFFLKFRGYNGGFNSEDYDLWLRMQEANPSWDNMDEALLNYRIHSNSTQKSKLAYYECAGYSLREFLKNKKLSNFIACVYHFAKALFK